MREYEIGPIRPPVIDAALLRELVQHPGQWVAVDVDENHVIAVSGDIFEVKQRATDQGIDDPMIMRVPRHWDRPMVL